MKKSGCLTIILFLALCASMFVNALLLAALGGRGSVSPVVSKPARETRFQEQVVQPGRTLREKIAVIPLEGIISFGQTGALGGSMVEDLQAAFHQAAEDDEVGAVVIAVDSPGGEITGSDVIYHGIRELAEKKPVVVYMNAIGTSGAYYAACGASWVMCNHTTFTGSIGVIISTLNYQELFGKIGLQAIVFKSGEFKDLLSGAREITPEEQAYVQGLVMQSYDRFLNIVAESRDLAPGPLRRGVGDGRILSGTDAHEANLVDQLGYIEDAYAKARELADTPGATVVRYRAGFNLGQFFRLFGESHAAAKTVELDIFPGMPRLQPGRVYLLPPFLVP